MFTGKYYVVYRMMDFPLQSSGDATHNLRKPGLSLGYLDLFIFIFIIPLEYHLQFREDYLMKDK